MDSQESPKNVDLYLNEAETRLQRRLNGAMMEYHEIYQAQQEEPLIKNEPTTQNILDMLADTILRRYRLIDSVRQENRD